MYRQEPELTDEDLERLARLGGVADQIAEAAGIDVVQVRRRLRALRPSRAEECRTRARQDDVVSC